MALSISGGEVKATVSYFNGMAVTAFTLSDICSHAASFVLEFFVHCLVSALFFRNSPEKYCVRDSHLTDLKYLMHS